MANLISDYCILNICQKNWRGRVGGREGDFGRYRQREEDNIKVYLE